MPGSDIESWVGLKLSLYDTNISDYKVKRTKKQSIEDGGRS